MPNIHQTYSLQMLVREGPLVAVRIGAPITPASQPLTALIDTGADDIFIREGLADLLDLPLADDDVPVRGITSDRIAHRRAFHCNIEMGEGFLPCRVVDVPLFHPTRTLDLLIGRSFLLEANLVYSGFAGFLVLSL